MLKAKAQNDNTVAKTLYSELKAGNVSNVISIISKDPSLINYQFAVRTVGFSCVAQRDSFVYRV